MSIDAPAGRRPVVVTLAVILIYVGAFANVLLGILVLLGRYQVEPAEVLTVSLLGAGTILFGLLLIAIASGLARGSRLSRILATVYIGILMLLHVVTIVTTDDWDWISLIPLAVEGLIVGVLWIPPGSRHFARGVAVAAH